MKGTGTEEKEEMTEIGQEKDQGGMETLHAEIRKIIVNIDKKDRKMILIQLVRELKQKTRGLWLKPQKKSKQCNLLMSLICPSNS